VNRRCECAADHTHTLSHTCTHAHTRAQCTHTGRASEGAGRPGLRANGAPGELVRKESEYAECREQV
jgi:hypothetical protein